MLGDLGVAKVLDRIDRPGGRCLEYSYQPDQHREDCYQLSVGTASAEKYSIFRNNLLQKLPDRLQYPPLFRCREVLCMRDNLT